MTRREARELGRWIGSLFVMLVVGAGVFHLARAIVFLSQLAQ